ncbi:MULTISPECIES: chaplin [Streptacidiphilus]|uniref:Small secreted domain n=1 Tax=Streptacidiphilus jiangxiensis TaxID=235985 RepID=A0A1H7Q6C1_STRJI|nr:chaplin [Streptacidiphilus jiangxiensis]SEL42837.1 Small secreted domain [Streptacidiphilus jiangxiensis]
MTNVLKGALVASAAVGAVVAAGTGAAFASSHACGDASNSPGAVSGNEAQVPVHVPVNVVGDSVNVIGLLNPAFGNHGANVG